MRSKLAMALGLIAVVLALTVAACGGSSSDNKETAPTSTTTAYRP